ncbi:MAG: hypothetical protein HW403_1499 [Dehalococcoidia bacterium]|nr:hypothetical protein [Dehalococcoidia bacterium]
MRDFDLIHLHFPFYSGAEMVFLKSLIGGTKYVVTYHQDVLIDGILGAALKLHHNLLGKRILKSCEKLFVTSMDYGMNSSIADLMIGQKDHVAEVPNGVDIKRFRASLSGHHLRELYGVQDGETVVLFTGALDRPHFFKGVDVLLRSVAQLPQESLKLVVVGDGDLREGYQRMAQELGIGGKVVFAGRVSDEELPNYYAMGDFLVLPSTTQGEAFGLVLIEAMACGKPVIASRLPGVRSVVDDGLNGLLVEPGSVQDLTAKIEWLLAHPIESSVMGQKGRQKVEQKYSWERIGVLLESLYYQAVESSATHERA